MASKEASFCNCVSLNLLMRPSLGKKFRTVALNSRPTGRGLALSKSKPGVLESFPIKNLRAESTRLSHWAQGLNGKRPLAATAHVGSFEPVRTDLKARWVA